MIKKIHKYPKKGNLRVTHGMIEPCDNIDQINSRYLTA